jgi:transposase-like protein
MAKNYSDQEKIRILEELEGGQRISDLAAEYGISRSTIHRWQKRFPVSARGVPRGEQAEQHAEGKQRGESTEAYLKRLEAENVRLKRIVVRQALKIDALQDKLGRRIDCCT